MGVFISHVAEDTAVALELAFLLEQAGFSSWCYELDSIPGVSHIQQTLQAIEESEAFVMLISPDCVQSHEVTTELTRAQDLDKVVIPLLFRINHIELMQRRSEWGQRLGNASCLVIDDLSLVMDRLIRSLKHHKVTAGPAPALRQTRLDAIQVELGRLGRRREPVKKPPPVPETPTGNGSPPPSVAAEPDDDKALCFRDAARHIDDVCEFIKGLLEREKLEAQVIVEGGGRIVQGRDPPQDGWIKLVKKGLGLERAATVKLGARGYDLTMEVGDGKWTDKAVGGAVGMFVFWPAAVTAGWGVYKQRDLFQRIERDVSTFLSGRAN